MSRWLSKEMVEVGSHGVHVGVRVLAKDCCVHVLDSVKPLSAIEEGSFELIPTKFPLFPRDLPHFAHQRTGPF